jgi:hypothetical protein
VSCADRFVGDIQTIDFDAGSSAGASTEGDGRESILRGVERSAILDLNAGFERGKVQKVPAVDGELFNLPGGDYVLYRGLFKVHANGIRFDADDNRFRAQFKFYVGLPDDSEFHGYGQLDRLEAFSFDANDIEAGCNASRIKGTGISRRGLRHLPACFACDSYPSVGDRRTLGIDDTALDASAGNRSLGAGSRRARNSNDEEQAKKREHTGRRQQLLTTHQSSISRLWFLLKDELRYWSKDRSNSPHGIGGLNRVKRAPNAE